MATLKCMQNGVARSAHQSWFVKRKIRCSKARLGVSGQHRSLSTIPSYSGDSMTEPFSMLPRTASTASSARLDSKFATPDLVFPSSHDHDDHAAMISLDHFIHQLPDVIRQRKRNLASMGCDQCEFDDDPITKLFKSVDLQTHDWDRMALFDPTRKYTRNLVATDHETFTLLLLCWNAGQESPIHDHPCDGCWLQVLQGQVQESRYVATTDKTAEGGKRLECVSEEIFSQGEMGYIQDSMGYHKVGNPCDSIPAVTMHLYSPPFQDCKVWVDEALPPITSSSPHYSEYGKITSNPNNPSKEWGAYL